MQTQTKVSDDILLALKSFATDCGLTMPEVTTRDVYKYCDYGESLTDQLNYLLRIWKTYEIAVSTDWEELERLQREEKERQLASRSVEARTNVVRSYFIQLLSNFRKYKPEGKVSFWEGDGRIYLAYEDEFMDLSMTYLVEGKELRTIIDHGVDAQEYVDETTTLSGMRNPSEQLKGYAAVIDFLGQ